MRGRKPHLNKFFCRIAMLVCLLIKLFLTCSVIETYRNQQRIKPCAGSVYHVLVTRFWVWPSETNCANSELRRALGHFYIDTKGEGCRRATHCRILLVFSCLAATTTDKYLTACASRKILERTTSPHYYSIL